MNIQRQRMTKKRMRFLSKSALAAILVSASLTAQSSGSEKTIQLDEVIAVGQYLQADQANALKTPTPIIDVPQSLTIVTEDQMRLQGFSSIGDIIDYTPGVNTSQGEGHRDSVVFRGVRSTADFYIDGMRDDVQYYRSLYNVEQVEILRGPNALLFGRGGTGGILNRATKKAQIGETFTGYKGSIDTFGETQVQLDSNYAINENAAFRFNIHHDNLEGHRDFYNGDRIGFNPTLRFQFNNATTIDLSYEFADHERFIDRGIPTGTNGKPVKEFEDIVFGDPELNKHSLEAHIIKGSIQHQFSDDLKGRFNAFYADYDKMYQNFYASSYNQASSPAVVTTDGYIDTTQRESIILSSDFVGEFETAGIEHTFVTGLEYMDTSNNNDRYNSFWSQTSDDNEIFAIARPLNLRGGVGVNSSGQVTTNNFSADLNDDTHADLTVFSAYFQDEIAISEMFDLVLGARFDSFDIDVFDAVANEKRSRKDQEISPRLGFIFKPKENISFYSSYSTSFIPKSGEQYASINGSNDRLDPDTYVNLEAGVKWDFAKGISLTAALFQVEESSPQVSDNDPSTKDVIDSKITGFEAQIQGWITDKWFLTAGYSYLDGEQEDRTGSTGLRPRELPEHMFSIWNNYSVTEKWGAGLGLIYQDESFINNGNTATLPSYFRVDAATHYQLTEKVRIQLNVENLTDELYFPNAHSTHQASVGAPIHAMFSVSGEF